MTSSGQSLAGGLNRPPFFLHMETNLKERIIELATPLVEAQGLKIWGLDIAGGPKTRVCLYVDIPRTRRDNEAFSANIDQCESISRQLGLAMEVENIFDGPWVLEVSSPGLERKFFNLDQMAPYEGDMIECSLLVPLERDPDRKVYRGRLAALRHNAFILELCFINESGDVICENRNEALIPWENTRRVKRIHIFASPKKPGKKSKKSNPKEG